MGGDTQPGDVARVRACLQKAGPRAISCIGDLYARCAEAARTEAVHERPAFIDLTCWHREGGAWDRLLNEAYTRQLASARETDRGPKPDEDVPSGVAALRAAQRAWIVFRDAECERVRALRAMAASDWRASAVEEAHTRLTAMRTVELMAD